MCDIVFVIGTRPQYIKSSIIINQLIKRGNNLKVIDTGQHYDANLSQIFLRELKFPRIENLQAGSASHAVQTANIIRALEPHLLRLKPKLVVVAGDTNSTLGAAITVAKLNIPMAHLESGLRSYDMTIPEEVNRVVTDRLSRILFCPSYIALANLQKERFPHQRIYFTGDTMYDVLKTQLPIAKKRKTLKKNHINYDYALATVHHSFNVDNSARLKNILDGFSKSGRHIVFLVHPRTTKMMRRFNLLKYRKRLHLHHPVGYHDMLNLMRNSEMIITDSGGMQKEAFWLRKPCITLKEDTVWTETVRLGANTLVGADTNDIVRAIKDCPSFPRRVRQPYGRGNASKKIVKILEAFL